MSMNESNSNNNPADGRPPPPPPPPPSSHRRAPSSMPTQGMVAGRNAQQQQASQSQQLPSFGEQAANANSNHTPLLSPIAPPQEEGSQSNETRHNRKVSWGGVTSPTLNLTPSGVASALASIIPQQQQQTQQQASEVSSNAAASNPTGSFLDNLQKSQAPSTRRFNLNEMLGSGPVEQEAETHILRAVEKISGQRHQRTPTEVASLFSEIAADDITRSMQQQQNEEHSDSEDEDDFFEDAPALGATEPPPKSSSFSSLGGDAAVKRGDYLTQVDSQEAIEVTAAPTTSNLESIPSHGSNGTDNTASVSSNEHPLLQTLGSNKSVGKSTRSLVGPAAAARSMRNLGGAAKSTRSLGNTGKSSRFLGTGAKSKFQSAVRKQMATNTVEQTLLGLTSTLNNMKEEEERKKEHRRQATHINMTENEKLKETANALAGHLFSSSDEKEAANNTNSPSRVVSDVEAPISSTKSNATAPGVIGDTDASSDDGSSVHPSNGNTASASDKNKKRKKHKKRAISNNIKEDFQLLQDFLSNRKWQMQLYIQRVFLFIMFPSIAVAALLFYFVENPALCQEEVERQVDSNGTSGEEGDSEVISFVCPDTGSASASWLILFIGVRQVITFTMALITQAVFVDYLCLNSRFSLRFFGPLITLFFVQARGWPFVTVFWAVYDLVLLTGDHDYTRHWGYWQEWVELFNANNPSGRIVEHELNYQILKLAIIVGVVVSIKRLFVSLYLGRATFAHFGEELAKVMKNMVIVGEVATLAKDVEYFAEQDQLDNSSGYHDENSMYGGWNDKDIQQLVSKADAERQAKDFEDSQVASNAATAAKTFMANRATPAKAEPTSKVPNNGQPSFCSPTPSMGGASSTVVNEEFSASEQRKLSDLLEAWEEPQTAEQKEEKKITIGAVLQFRQALTFMQKRHPFLPAFGPADTRERCVESAQRCYERLMLRTPDRLELPFETIALLAKDEKGRINQEKAKELIRVFRPDREGNITKLDFVRSVDAIYKSIRLLAANIRNSSQIDMAVEGIINVVFYIVLGSFVLGQLGVNPLQLFFSLSSVILAFAFMFSNSSSKYFEGMLFILVQRPYGVGDRIHLSNPQLETNIDGSSGWIVEKVSLYTTSLYWGATNERCTIANGAISNLRVINAARSPHAQIFVNIKFAIDTEYEKIVIFKAAVEQFLKDRPREWLTFVGFRPTEVAVERGFINYVTIAQHRASWQDIGAVLTSKAELVTYELEVAKQLQMRYLSPPLPVDLTLKGCSTNEMTPDVLKGMTGWSSS